MMERIDVAMRALKRLRLVNFLVFILLAITLNTACSVRTFPDSGICYGYPSNGKKKEISCGLYVMDKVAIKKSVDDFRRFESSDLDKEVREAARVREADTSRQAKLDALVKEGPFNETLEDAIRIKSLPEHEQAALRKRQAEALIEYESMFNEFRPEVERKVSWIKGGKYKVYLRLANVAGFPEKRGFSDFFYDNQSKEFAEYWRKEILQFYLSSDYEIYRPELGSVSDVVTIKLYLENGDQLEGLIKNMPIQSIEHIGSPHEEFEEILP